MRSRMFWGLGEMRIACCEAFLMLLPSQIQEQTMEGPRPSGTETGGSRSHLDQDLRSGAGDHVVLPAGGGLVPQVLLV